jgi:uncharacterized Zn-finger protein
MIQITCNYCGNIWKHNGVYNPNPTETIICPYCNQRTKMYICNTNYEENKSN